MDALQCMYAPMRRAKRLATPKIKEISISSTGGSDTKIAAISSTRGLAKQIKASFSIRGSTAQKPPKITAIWPTKGPAAQKQSVISPTERSATQQPHQTKVAPFAANMSFHRSSRFLQTPSPKKSMSSTTATKQSSTDLETPPPQTRATTESTRRPSFSPMERTHAPCAKTSTCAECSHYHRSRTWGFEWLACQVKDGRWTAGCSICAALLKLSQDQPTLVPPRILENVRWKKFASFSIDSVLQRGVCKKHAQSISHAFAVKMVGGGTASASCILADKAPSEDQFRKVLSAVKKPGGTSSVANVGGAEKIKRMVWCLAEGRRDLIRSKLSVASTIAIHQDKGKSRLHVRATSCSSTLQQSGTVLGIQKMTGGHREIIDTTDSILKKFCTPNYGRPMASRERCKSPSAREPALDTTLYDRIRSKVELWNTDAASDCSLAGKLLHSDAVKSKETMTDIGKVLFENLRAVNWDCSHASRRMTSRPWQCDSYIRETMWIVLFKKKSIIKMIQNSQEFRQMLLANLKDLKTVLATRSWICVSPAIATTQPQSQRGGQHVGCTL